jgi:hypothetical protein
LHCAFAFATSSSAPAIASMPQSSLLGCDIQAGSASIVAVVAEMVDAQR